MATSRFAWALVLVVACEAAPRPLIAGAPASPSRPSAAPASSAVAARSVSPVDAPIQLRPFALSGHRIVWPRDGVWIAAAQVEGCPPPSGPEDRCERREQVVAKELRSNRTVHFGAGELLGFRADGIWIMLRQTGHPELQEWSPSSGAVRSSAFAERTRDVQAACISPDDDHVLVVTRDDAVVLRSRTTAAEVNLAVPQPPSACGFSPDGHRFALAYEDHVAVHRVEDGVQIAITSAANVTGVDWSPDGSRVLLAAYRPESQSYETSVWNPATKPVQRRQVASVVGLDARGRYVMRSACEWHVATAKGAFVRLGAAPPETCAMTTADDLVIAPDGKRVAALEGAYGSRALVVLPLP